MVNYKSIILNCLLNKYERSRTFVGDNKVSQTFSEKIDKLFPVYSDSSEYHSFCAINDAVSDLESDRLIFVKRERNGVVKSISLNVENVVGAYKCLGRTPKKDVINDISVLLFEYENKNPILSKYCCQQKHKIKANQSVEYFDGDVEMFENILKSVEGIFKLHEETFERNFSVRVLGDSKTFEKIRTKVSSLLFEYGDFPDKESVLPELNLIRNPGHVHFKGNGRIFLKDQIIDLSKIAGDIAISSTVLRDIDKIEIFGSSVLTIENLTTFNTFSSNDVFVVYLGGYHNNNRRLLLKQIFNDNPQKKFLHWGDIDAGGFQILEHLRQKTNIDFKPFCMDLKSLTENQSCAKPLTVNDRTRLEKFLNGEFDEVVRYMLKSNIKLEQESLDIEFVVANTLLH